MWDNAKKLVEKLGDSSGGPLRDFALGLLGGVTRLAFDHRKYDGISPQFCYDFFRTVAITGIMVIFTRAAVDSWCLSSPITVALFAGCCFFAYEILYLIKKTIGTIIEGYIKGFIK